MGGHRRRAGKNRRSAYEILSLLAEGPLPPYSPFPDLRYQVDVAPRGGFWQVSAKAVAGAMIRRLPVTRKSTAISPRARMFGIRRAALCGRPAPVYGEIGAGDLGGILAAQEQCERSSLLDRNE